MGHQALAESQCSPRIRISLTPPPRPPHADDDGKIEAAATTHNSQTNQDSLFHRLMRQSDAKMGKAEVYGSLIIKLDVWGHKPAVMVDHRLAWILQRVEKASAPSTLVRRRSTPPLRSASLRPLAPFRTHAPTLISARAHPPTSAPSDPPVRTHAPVIAPHAHPRSLPARRPPPLTLAPSLDRLRSASVRACYACHGCTLQVCCWRRSWEGRFSRCFVQS